MKKNTICGMIIIVALSVIILLSVFLLPKSGIFNHRDTTEITTETTTEVLIHNKNKDEYLTLKEKVIAYRNGDTSVFASKGDFTRAESYVAEYERYQEAFGRDPSKGE